MEPLEFNEGELPDLQKLGVMLFADEHDPKSVAYKRVLVRPKINWLIVFGYIILPIAIAVAGGIALSHFGAHIVVSVTLPCILALIFFMITAKQAVIYCIKIYQRYAPDAIRNKCRFEPSCSEYAIMALQKYGLISGLRKAVDRLRRCNINGGGIDYP